MVVESPSGSSTVPGWVAEALSWVGLRWPEGDTGRLSAAGDAWIELGGTLRRLHDAAGGVARVAWQPPNRGEIVDSFQRWWNAEAGPERNLARAAAAAENIGTALRGLSVQILLLRAAFVAELAALAAFLVGAGLLIAGSLGTGTVVVAGAGAFAVNRVRQAMIRRLEATIATVASLLIVGLLLRASADLVPAQVRPRRDRRTRPEPGPDDRPPPPPPIPPWNPERRPRCQVPPGQFLPHATPLLIGNPDPRTTGGHILRIQRELDGTARVHTIDGVMSDPLPQSQRLGTPQYELQIARQSIGLPAGLYDACHAYGPGFGSEAAAGMGLCPTLINNNPGAMGLYESRLRQLYDRVSADGGWVELQVQSRTFQSSDWLDASGRPVGANLLNSVDYTATVCQPNRVLDVYRFGLTIDPPAPGTGIPPATARLWGRPP